MRRVEALGRLQHDVHQLRKGRLGVFLEETVERFAVHIFHDQERPAGGILFLRVNLRDARVIESHGRLGLPLEPPQRIRLASRLGIY